MQHIKEFKQYLTDNFWKWFGDSKVVSNNGKPLVVYHGSHQNFDIFKSDIGNSDTGIYFTDNITHSQDYGELLYEVYLKIENPVILDAQHKYFDDYFLILIKEIRYAESSDEYDGVIIHNIKDPKEGKPFKDDDGEWVDYDSSTVYVVFNSNQIKSATTNNGNFNINSENINENKI
jgi:hypothetical protein